MKEFRKALDISLKGAAAGAALARSRRHLAQWKLTMPPWPPLVLDFGVGDFQRTGLIEYWIANEDAAGYCGKFLFVLDGQTCPLHRHRTKHETFLVVKGKVRMRRGRKTTTLKEGDVLPVRPWTYHCFTGVGPALLLEVSTPCEVADNYFANPAVPIGHNYRGARNP